MAYRAGDPPLSDPRPIDRAVRPYRDTLRAVRQTVARRDEQLITTREALREIDALAARRLEDS